MGIGRAIAKQMAGALSDTVKKTTPKVAKAADKEVAKSLDKFTKTRKAYKLFVKGEDEKLYPLFVNARQEVPQGEWLEADFPDVAFKGKRKEGSKESYYVPTKGAVRGKGEKSKNTGDPVIIPDEETRQKLIEAGFITEKAGRTKEAPFGKVTAVAARPGWHSSANPVAEHLGPQDLIVSRDEVTKLLDAGINPKAIKKRGDKFYVKRRAEDQVWAEVEMADDTSDEWAALMKEQGRTDINDRIPKGGSYSYQDGQADSDSWVVGGDMRINRTLSREEAKALQEEMGVKDLPYRDEVENILGRKFAEGGMVEEVGATDQIVLGTNEGEPTALDPILRQHYTNIVNDATVPAEDGGVHTVYTKTFELEDGRTVLIPTVFDGQLLDDKAALDRAYEDGAFMIFESDAEARTYDQKIHEQMSPETTKEEAIQFLVEDAKGSVKQFAKGGSVEKDPVSGNEVPKGALPNEVRDDVPAMLSEGEFVIPADVVRYIGLDKLRKMRDQAKKGLEDMDAEGQIGGEPVDMADAFAQGGMATQRMAQTAQQTQQALYTPPQEGQSMYTFNQPKQTTTPTVATTAPTSTSYEMRRYQHPDGRVMYVPIIGGVEQIDVPEGFVVVDRAEAIGKDAEEVKTGEDADGEGASAGTGTGVSCPAGTEWNGSECVPVSISDNSEEELMGSSASSIVGDMNDYLNDDELEKIQDDMVWAEVKVAAQALVAPTVAIAKGIAGVKTDAQKELEALQQKAADRTAVVMSEKRTDLDPTQLESFKANMAEVTLGALQNKSTISNEDRQALKADIDARFEVAVENGMDPEVAASLKTQALNGVMVSPAAKELGGIRAVAKPSAAKIAEPNLVQKGIEDITGVNKEVRSEEQLREEVRAEIDKGKSVADAVKTVQETLNPKEARAFEAAKIKDAMAATEKAKDKTATEKAVEADKVGAVGDVAKTIDDVVNEVMGVKPEDVKEEASAKGRPDYVSQNIKGAKATTAAANAAKIQAQMDALAADKNTSTWQPSGTTTRTSGGGWTTNYTGGGSMTQAAPATAPSTPSTSSQRRGYTPSSSSSSSGGNYSSSSSSGGYSTGSRGSSSYGGNTSRGYSGGYGGWAEGGLITKKNTKKKKTKKKLGITKK